MNKDTISDIQVKVEVVLGTTMCSVEELGKLTADSILELDTPVGERAEIRVGGTVIGRGDVVVVGDQFGVRIVEFLEQSHE